jgi:Zn-dependent protease with chaperone function
MNFFEAQERARKRTGWLVVLFGLATVTLILITNLLLLGIFAYGQTGEFIFSPVLLTQQFEWDVFIGVAIVVSALIFLGSLYKIMSLSDGGRSVAEMLGGRLITRNTTDPDERRVLNVVEEMAIASGISVPNVYLLDETAINAFAAGLTPNDAVIGVTQGTLRYLDRDELQGVIAHEFSHIFNGDMRMNIRLIGVLHGILLLGMIGYYILRATRYVRSSRNREGAGAIAAVLALGVGLVVIGYTGFFFGQLIKSMVSRQREYLADASAVQFTRNKQGIAGALKKIGGLSAGSLLDNPAAPQYSHAYFSQGVSGFLQSLFATHPPLKTRIKRIDPAWSGEFIAARKIEPPAEKQPRSEDVTARTAILTGTIAAGVLTANEIIDQVGTVNEEQVEVAQEIIATIPAVLRQAAEEPFGARAIIYGMLIDKNAEIEAEQRQILTQLADPAVAEHTRILKDDLVAIPVFARLPLLELTIPALQELSAPQYRQFRKAVQSLIAADKKVDLKEWVLQRLVMQQLDEYFGLRQRPKATHAYLGAVKKEAEIILSLVAYTEHQDAATAEKAFNAGKSEVGAGALQFVKRDHLTLDNLNTAIDELEKLKPLLKPRILKACAACIMYDQQASIRGQEILRAVASTLDCPMPLLSAFK